MKEAGGFTEFILRPAAVTDPGQNAPGVRPVHQEHQERRLTRSGPSPGDLQAGHRTPITEVVDLELADVRIVEDT